MRQQESGKQDVDMSDILDDFARKARDHARAPMQVRSLHFIGISRGTDGLVSGMRARKQASQGVHLG